MVTGAVTVRKSDRLALIVFLKVFDLVLLNATAGTCGGYILKEETANLFRDSFSLYLHMYLLHNKNSGLPQASNTEVVLRITYKAMHVAHSISHLHQT